MKTLLAFISLIIAVAANSTSSPVPELSTSPTTTSVSTISIPTTTEVSAPHRPPPHNFLGRIRTTSGNITKECSVAVITPTNVICAPSCTFFDKEKAHNVTYEICYSPNGYVKDYNSKDCRILQYEYKPGVDFTENQKDNQTELRVVAIEDICLFELREDREFELGDDTNLPIIYPYATVSELENLEGFVVSWNGTEIVYDYYDVKPSEQPTDNKLSTDKVYFYTKMELSEVYRYGAPFIVQGQGNITFLMGIMDPEDHTFHRFTFVPSCFERATQGEADLVFESEDVNRKKRGAKKCKREPDSVSQFCATVSEGFKSFVQMFAAMANIFSASKF